MPAHVAGQPHSGRIRRSLTRVQVSVSHATLSALVTHRARDPPIWSAAYSVAVAIAAVPKD